MKITKEDLTNKITDFEKKLTVEELELFSMILSKFTNYLEHQDNEEEKRAIKTLKLIAAEEYKVSQDSGIALMFAMYAGGFVDGAEAFSDKE